MLSHNITKDDLTAKSVLAMKLKPKFKNEPSCHGKAIFVTAADHCLIHNSNSNENPPRYENQLNDSMLREARDEIKKKENKKSNLEEDEFHCGLPPAEKRDTGPINHV